MSARMKPKHTQDILTVTDFLRLTQTQVDALRTLTRATGDQDDGRIVARVFSLGCYVLGIDPAGDFSTDELTDALYGESKESREVNQTITDAGHDAETAWLNHERKERARTFAKAEEAGA
jgi:hypothetical protein